MIRLSQVGKEDATRLMIVLRVKQVDRTTTIYGVQAFLQCTPLALYSSPHYDRVAKLGQVRPGNGLSRI